MSEAPPAGDGSNRRKFVRVPLTTMLQYRVESMDNLLEDPTVDVSEGGLFLRTQNPRPDPFFALTPFSVRPPIFAAAHDMQNKLARTTTTARSGLTALCGNSRPVLHSASTSLE